MGAWLISNPMGWIILLGGTIAATVGLVDLFTTSVEEHREKLESLKSEYSDIKSELDGLKGELDGTQSRINELENKGKLTFTEAEELNNLRKQNNELQRSIDLLELQKKTKSKETNNQFIETMNSDIEQELYTRNENGEVVQYMPMSGQTATDDNEADYITQRFKDLEKLRDKLSSASTEAEKERIKRQIKGIEDYFVQKNKDFTETAKGIDYIQNPTTEDDKKVNKWLDYINDFQDKMAVAMDGENAKENAFNRLVDNWKFDEALNPLQKLGKEGKVTLDELKKRMDDPVFVKFVNKLKDIGFISDTTDGSLRFLANAFNGTTQAARSYVNQLSDLSSIKKFISNIDEEAKALGTTKEALGDLVQEHILFNNTGLDTSGQISALQLLGSTIDGLSGKTTRLISLLKYAAGDFSGSKLSAGTVYDADGNAIHRTEDEIRNINARRQGSAQAELDKMKKDWEKIQGLFKEDGNENPPPYTSGDDKDSSSSKNSALDNYLKDAENRYKIHQDETEYINDLNYALNNLVKTEDERLDVTGKINEAYRDLADNRIKDLEHQIDLTKELKGENADVTSQYKEIQKVAIEEAERLRAMGYDNNSNEIQALQKTWWDAENSKLDFYSKQHEIILRDIEHARDMVLNADEDANVTSYYKQLQDEYHREAERLRALDPEKYKEDIQELQQLWWDVQNEMLDYNKQVVEDFLDELQTKLDDSYDIRISRLNSQSSLLSSHFNIVNAIAEEQHNLNKELLEAETIGAKMSEQERESLLTRAEHNKLSGKLSNIMLDITDLQSDYMRDLEKATEDTIEEVTNQYERQYELKMKEYEIIKAELNLIKKQQILENTQNEKSVRTWNGSSWIYEANLQDVLDAQEEVENAKYELARAQAEEAQQVALNAIDANADALETEKNKLTSVIEDMAERMDGSGKDITSMLKTIAETDLPTFDAIIQSMGESIKEALNLSDDDINAFRTSSNFTINPLAEMKKNSSAWHTATTQEERDSLVSANKVYARMLGLEYEESTGRWKKKDGTYAYASGTKNAKKGVGLFDEKGFGSEVVLTNDGILTQFNGGERVFSPEMADRLWEMAQKNNILTPSIRQPDLSNVTTIEERINNAINNAITNNAFGDTYMIKDVQVNDSNNAVRGFMNYLKKIV